MSKDLLRCQVAAWNVALAGLSLRGIGFRRFRPFDHRFSPEKTML
jgi:hypothetical protein